MDSTQRRYSREQLLSQRGPRSFRGQALSQVAFPLGGIGTGNVSLGGRGDLRDWEIFNRPGKGKLLPYTFFSLWCQPEGAQPVARLMERRFLPPYQHGFGIPTLLAPGLPRLAEATFTGTYPFARIDFADDQLPLRASLRAYNPFIPMNAEDSGIPVAVFKWTLTNPGFSAVQATLALSLLNAVGHNGQIAPGNRYESSFGGNLNEFVRSGDLAELRMSSTRYGKDDPRFGTLAIATSWADTTHSTRWERAGWWDDLQDFWDDFSTDGRLPDHTDADPSPAGQTDVGTLGALITLQPGESVTVPFLLAWHFPNHVNYWNGEESVAGKRLTNYYATRFGSAWEAAEHTADNLPRLEAETRAYHDTLLESTLPDAVIDAVSSQASILRTTTCLRTGDGRFHAFEGCGDNSGCCPMNCTHVWNYEQAVAHLFPELERTVRDTDFGVNTLPDGNMAFRSLLPLATEHRWAFVPAADGQMGTLLRLFREWKQSGDTEWLRHHWPRAKAALEFAWSDANPHRWDADHDGVMEGVQHNTYDIEFHGPNSMMGSWYLAALHAGAAMAQAVGEAKSAREYLALAERGARGHDALWNGEFYVHDVRPQKLADGAPPINEGKPFDGEEPRYQYAAGCLADQLLGQWFAHCVGLGYVLPEDKVRKAVESIFRHNYLPDFTQHYNCQRVYAVNDEAGLLLCTWPNGGRPKYPFPYADEVWTGIEYQVAAHLIYEGLLEEGLTIVKSLRDRHDGERRNPWDEFECGHHYARAMASWSLLLALSGYQYSAPEGRLGFAPKLEGDFRCFFTGAEGWGLYTREANRHQVALRYGTLALRSLVLPDLASDAGVTLNGAPVAGQVTDGVWRAESPLSLSAGDTLGVG
ncbi:MAG TPA: GH116 family glycosyl-hydrolase [Armatimonadota bacterium]|jgi:uncharacterized protein (DUF608 family)